MYVMCARVMQTYFLFRLQLESFKPIKVDLYFIIVDAQETVCTFVWDYVLDAACVLVYVCVCIRKA